MAIDLMGKGRPGKGAGIMSPVGGKGKKGGKSAMKMLVKRKMRGKR